MLVGGRYETIRELGRGSFGKTYLAEDTYRRGGAKYVVKRLPLRMPNPAVSQAARELFDREVQILYKLGKHEQIPRLLAHIEQSGEFYLVQELIDGHALQLPLGGKLEEEEAISLLQEILQLLAVIHQQGVTHQDIKPENFIRRWSDRKLVLIDFGVVKTLRNLGIDGQGQVKITQPIGTPGYMPKEQLEGQPQLCSDVYAVGMIGIQSITGFMPNQLPRDPVSQEVIWHDQAQVSKKFQAILDQMVRYNAADRYQSAMAVLEAFGVPVAAAAVVSVPSTPPVPTPQNFGPKPVEVKKPGYVVIAPRFELARPFAEGLAGVMVGDKLGYVDKEGKFLIPPQFDINPRSLFRRSFYQFYDGLACVETGHHWGYVNQAGVLTVPAVFDSAEGFSEGLARVEVDHHYGFVDKTGAFVIAPSFESSGRIFREGLVGVQIDGKYGYMDRSGQIMIPPTFESAERFVEGLARVTMNHRYGFINKRGQFAIFPQFDVAHSFYQGLARVRIDGKYGYIDKTGTVKILAQFDDNTSFSEDLALVRNGEKYGYINKVGKMVIPLQFDDAYPFSEGLAAVKVSTKWGYIDPSGIFVINLQFDDAGSFSEGLAAVKLDNKWGYIGK